MATAQMSGGAMMGWAIILAILLWLFPLFVIWIAWILVISLFISGLFAIMQG